MAMHREDKEDSSAVKLLKRRTTNAVDWWYESGESFVVDYGNFESIA